MAGGGYWAGIGGTASAGFQDGPLPGGLDIGLLGHVEAAAAGGVPISFGGSIDSDGRGGLALGRGFGGLGEGLFAGSGLSLVVQWATKPCGCED